MSRVVDGSSTMVHVTFSQDSKTGSLNGAFLLPVCSNELTEESKKEMIEKIFHTYITRSDSDSNESVNSLLGRAQFEIVRSSARRDRIRLSPAQLIIQLKERLRLQEAKAKQAEVSGSETEDEEDTVIPIEVCVCDGYKMEGIIRDACESDTLSTEAREFLDELVNKSRALFANKIYEIKVTSLEDVRDCAETFFLNEIATKERSFITQTENSLGETFTKKMYEDLWDSWINSIASWVTFNTSGVT